MKETETEFNVNWNCRKFSVPGAGRFAVFLILIIWFIFYLFKFFLYFTNGYSRQMDEIDAMFCHLLGEIDHLSQVSISKERISWYNFTTNKADVGKTRMVLQRICFCFHYHRNSSLCSRLRQISKTFLISFLKGRTSALTLSSFDSHWSNVLKLICKTCIVMVTSTVTFFSKSRPDGMRLLLMLSGLTGTSGLRAGHIRQITPCLPWLPRHELMTQAAFVLKLRITDEMKYQVT